MAFGERVPGQINTPREVTVAEETFTCDRCGKEFPVREMKEAFIEEDGQRVKKNFDASCLDQVMNASGDVRGVPGDEKRAAVAIDPEGAGGDRESLGRRQ
jgi:hypothetical protein